MNKLAVALFIAVAATLLSGCMGYSYLEPAIVRNHYTISPEIVRDEVRIVWHRVKRVELERLSSVFMPPELAKSGVGLGGMALPGPDGECHVFAPEPTSDPSPEAQTLGHEVMHCFFGAYHSPEWVPYATGATWPGLSEPWVARQLLARAMAAIEGRPAPEPMMPPENSADCGGGSE